MWKPGTAKPNKSSNAPSKIQLDPSSKAKSPKGSSNKSPANKKLSGSTMGMRFMQRKVEAKKQVQEERFKPAVDRQNNSNNDAITTNRDENGAADRKRDSEEISNTDQQQSSSNYTNNNDEGGGVIILELASVADMHGTGSDIIGRRSFGGFHKSVRSTWEDSLKRRTDDEARTKQTKAHITDEELLERYEKYVGGGGGRKDKRKR